MKSVVIATLAAAIAISCGVHASPKPSTSKYKNYITSPVLSGADGRVLTPRHRLKGNVKSARVEVAEYSSISGKLVEGPKELASILTIDENGSCEVVTYGEDRLPKHKGVYTCDKSGKLVEESEWETDGQGISKLVFKLISKEVYVYNDKSGKLIETDIYNSDGQLGKKLKYNYDPTTRHLLNAVLYDQNGKVEGKKTFHYNSKGNRDEEKILWPDGSQAFKHIYKYNGCDKPTEITGYGSDNTVIGKTRESAGRSETTYSYPEGTVKTITIIDSQDNSSCTDEYGPKGELIYRRKTESEYDGNGNWIKRVWYDWVTEDGKGHFEPIKATYREITYASGEQK